MYIYKERDFSCLGNTPNLGFEMNRFRFPHIHDESRKNAYDVEAQILVLVIKGMLRSKFFEMKSRSVKHIITTLHFLQTSYGYEDKSIINLIVFSPFSMLQETIFAHPDTHTYV